CKRGQFLRPVIILTELGQTLLGAGEKDFSAPKTDWRPTQDRFREYLVACKFLRSYRFSLRLQKDDSQ
ncbi:MAG TPA: hypothetical protein VGR30_11150, partial [Candidatus Binatia bacterium]|nr:hypothetical protein [Candidatus Binatia bacterium]